VLSSSGHILGIINPPSPTSKRTYRAGNLKTSDTMADWEAHSEEYAGSWWPDWFEWLHARTGNWVSARVLSNRKFPKICAAPGNYVLEVSDHSAG
jgi:polyhydroxyalkanoate synthase